MHRSSESIAALYRLARRFGRYSTDSFRAGRSPCKASRRAPNSEGRRARSSSAHIEPSMTSLRQIETNRRNALRSTGPRTENGKRLAAI